jgi:hypothetical protein
MLARERKTPRWHGQIRECDVYVLHDCSERASGVMSTAQV